jgi:hypothetical protein
MPYAVLGLAALSVLAARSVDAIAPWVFFLNSMIAMSCQATRRATHFEGGLPIAARSLYAARVLALLIVQLAPAVAATASIAFVRTAVSGVALAPLQMTGFSLLLTAILLSARPKQTHGPRWLFFAVYLPIYGGAMWAFKRNAAAPAAAACAALAAVLVIRTWFAIPESFQIALAADLRPARTSKRNTGKGAMAWGPVLRSVFSGFFIMFLCYLPGGTFGGEWLLAGAFVSFLWVAVRQKTRWLRALPVNPKSLLATFVAPILLMLLAGYFAGFHIGRHPRAMPDERTLVVNVACIVGWPLLMILISAATDWRLLRRVVFILRPAWMITAFLVLPLASTGVFSSASWRRVALSQSIALQISGALPQNLLLATVLLASILLAVYWAANRVFEDAELSDKPVTKRDMDAVWGK